MARAKQHLIVVLAVGAGLIVLHKLLDRPALSVDTWFVEVGWHYWLALAYWVFVAGYVLTRRCQYCKAPQVYRGVNPREWHWPEKSCWKCGADLEL
jgi:hypothetical protein